MADVEAAAETEAQAPESIPPEAFDLTISDMFANAKLLANVRTSDAVGELKHLSGARRRWDARTHGRTRERRVRSQHAAHRVHALRTYAITET